MEATSGTLGSGELGMQTVSGLGLYSATQVPHVLSPWRSCLQASEDRRSQGQLHRDCLQAVMVSLEVPECT